MSSDNGSQSLEDDPSVPPRATSFWLDNTADASNSSKPYHATSVWGKRKMTLQELTRAFDAFNEDEERVALGFAGSEDCNRTLAEPLSEVKTVFLDLDGLKPQSGYPSLSPVSSVANSPQPSNGSYVLQVNSDINPREGSELAYIMRADEVASGSNASRTLDYYPDIEHDHRVYEDTIKPYQKRRQSLLATSLSAVSPRYTLKLRDEPETGIAAQSPSRLGFVDDGNIDEYGREGERGTFRLDVP